jgi:hypothetical protein
MRATGVGMIGYASRTGTLRNLAVLRQQGWRLLVSPGNLRTEGFPYALDNGAWSAFQRGVPFDGAAFSRAVDMLGGRADWIVAPDIVGGGQASLGLSAAWLSRLTSVAPVLLAVQDGIEPSDVSGLVRYGIFLGGTTEYKLATMAEWGAYASERGCYFHVGRVNTRRRIMLCAAAGADSFDGTSVSRFAETMPLLDNALRQPDLYAPKGFT